MKDSEPARPFGDLVELIAGEKLVLLKELLDLIEKRALKLFATSSARESRCPLTPETTARGDKAQDQS